ncbi:MAG: TonB-dependent receptor [Chitinophagaceae bacterium]|jgi:iron complex outermembrane receptor protein|nr:TonB-dependent receptor [Chitinophagaceae bacterium]
MKKFVLSGIAGIFLFAFSFGQNLTESIIVSDKNRYTRIENFILSGKIINASTGLPLPGASVYVQDEKIGAIADANGNYRFNNIPAGHHLMEISHTGFLTIVEHVDISVNIQKDYALQPSIIESEGVTVTGVTSATSIRNAPIPITIFRRTELLRNASTNLIDALTQKPGISQVGTGPGISKPVIRGLGYNRVVVIHEGAKQEGQQWGDEHGIEIDELSISKVEVLKGPASLIYGSDALGGVINILSSNPVQDGTIKGNVLTNYQTNNRLYAAHANLAGNRNGFNWNAYGTFKSAGDYTNKYDGRVLNSRFNEKNFGGYIGLNKGWGYSHLIFSSFNQKVGLIEGERDDASGKFILYGGTPMERIANDNDLKSRELFIPYQSINHHKIVSDNSIAIGEGRLKLNAGYQNNQRKEFGEADAPDEKELFFDLHTLHYNMQWVMPEKDDWRTTLGFNGMNQFNRNKGEELIIPDYDLNDLGVFVFTQKMYQQITLSGGLRFDNRNIQSKEFIEGGDIKFTAFEKSFSNISGSLGLSYKPSEYVTVRANLARGFRAPNLAELASNGAHEGTNRYEYGSIDLKSERSYQADAGIDVHSEHISLRTSFFYNTIRNFIYYRKLNAVAGGDSIIVDGNDQFFAFRFDQVNARLYGFEFNVDIHPHPLDWLHVENTFSYVRGKLSEPQDGSDNIPFIPAPRMVNEVKADFLRNGKWLKDLYVKVELDNTFKQNNPFTGYDTETITPGYSLLNAGAGGDIYSKGRVVANIYFSANNITDKAYQNHLSRLKYTAENNATGRQGVFNMGRNFSLKVNVPFSGIWN